MDPDQLVILATVDWPELLLANEEVQAYRHHEILHEIDVECRQIRVVVIQSKAIHSKLIIDPVGITLLVIGAVARSVLRLISKHVIRKPRGCRTDYHRKDLLLRLPAHEARQSGYHDQKLSEHCYAALELFEEPIVAGIRLIERLGKSKGQSLLIVSLKVMEKIDSEVEIHPIAPPASRLGAGRL